MNNNLSNSMIKSNKSGKTGRKGDPRMQRAVLARLANPDLSLFDALRIGGFEYAMDEDANVIDSEQVTLSQRKNQLSRRLRFARKRQEGNEIKEDVGEDGSTRNAHSRGGGVTDTQSNMASNISSAPDMSLMAQKQLEKLMQHTQQAKLFGGIKRNNEEMNADEDEEEELGRKLARNHPQYHPLFTPRDASSRNHSPSGSPSLPARSAQTQSSTQITQLSVPASAPAQTTLEASKQHSALGTSSSFLSQQGGTADLVGQTSRRSSEDSSDVALRSLKSTAKSVGMTLEQFAATLAASSNLEKFLSDTDAEQKQELALSLHQSEAPALYQRCMLLAGFNPNETDKNSQAHLDFALNAWQREGKRLQKLVSNRDEKCVDLPEVATSTSERTLHQELSQQTEQAQENLQQQQQNQHGRIQISDQQFNEMLAHHQLRAQTDVTSHTHRIHLLEGKFDHKSNIHLPQDGAAHVNFVEGDEVECHNETQSFGVKASSLWPSKYNCGVLQPARETCHGQPFVATKQNIINHGVAPKIFESNQMNSQGKELTSDPNRHQVDGLLLGLFQLGEAKSSNPHQHSQDNNLQVRSV